MMKFFRRRSGGEAAPNASAEEPRAAYLEQHPEVVHVDMEALDAETRAIYRDAREAAAEDAEEKRATPMQRREFVIKAPFQVGFSVTLGVLVAVLAGGLVGELRTVIMYVVAALFVALGLDPVVRFLERRHINRPAGIAMVFGGFVLVLAGIIALVAPVIARQITQLVEGAPALFRAVTSEQWFDDLNDRFGEYIDFTAIVRAGQDLVGNPDNWAQVAGGVWQAGIGIANGLTAALVILILSLYFLASLRTIKRTFYTMVPRSGRAKVIDITEQVTQSIGGYVSGMVMLALLNAVLGFIVMTIVHTPFAGLVAVGVFLLALIPLIGSVAATVLVSLVSLIESPTAAIITAVYYLIYMQIEAYVLTPRIMNRAVSVPGSLVVIGALAGGTLLGLLGALIAIPVTAMVLMIIQQVWIPRQERR